MAGGTTVPMAFGLMTIARLMANRLTLAELAADLASQV